MNFGVVGYGRFGRLWAEALLPFGEVRVYEKNISLSGAQSAAIKMTSLEAVAAADMVFILVPISELAFACEQIKPLLVSGNILLDGCSVKTYPAQIMSRIFGPTQAIIATHPLFGPDSVQRNGGFNGHKIVCCPIHCSEQQQNTIENLFIHMGLRVFNTTPDEHDKEMASSQALVHFIGRGLAALDLKPQQIATPDFQALLNINQMVINDTWRLFLDMHQYNPYTKQIRKRFVHQLLKLEQAIEDGKVNRI